jgi:hypothetical protein
MEVRDGNITSPDFGGHCFTYYDEATGVTTVKPIGASTTYDEIKQYCHDYMADANLSNVDAYAAVGLPTDEYGFWTANVNAITTGARYIRTKKGKLEGFDATHTIIAFDYKTNTAHSGGQIYYQEGFNSTVAGFEALPPFSTPSIKLTVADDWQTCYVFASLPGGAEEWGTTDNSYLWIVFSGWENNTTDGIELQVKNLRYITQADYDEENPNTGETAGPTMLTLSPWPGTGTEETADMQGEKYFNIGSGATFNGLFQTEAMTEQRPADNVILDFDYKSTIKGNLLAFIMPAQTALFGGALTTQYEEKDGLTIDNLDAHWDHFQLDLTNFGISAFAPSMGSNHYLWFWWTDAVADDILYIRNARLVSEAYLAQEAAEAGVQAIGVDQDSEVVASEYFDLQGRQLNAAPESGLFLQRNTHANGAITTAKVVK